MINVLIGVCGRTHSYLYKSYSPTNKLELLEMTPGKPACISNLGDLFEIVVKTEVLSIRTTRVIFNQIWDIETSRIAEVIRLGTSIKNVIPMSCRTDCATSWSPRASSKRLRGCLSSVMDSKGEPVYRFQEAEDAFNKYCPKW